MLGQRSHRCSGSLAFVFCFQVMVYKSDFEEERKDRAVAHSKFADLEKQMTEQTNNFNEEMKAVSDELERHKMFREELEKAVREARDNSEQWRAEAVQGHEELLAKTSQVKAYKKQVDQLKADLEERSQQVQAGVQIH